MRLACGRDDRLPGRLTCPVDATVEAWQGAKCFLLPLPDSNPHPDEPVPSKQLPDPPAPLLA